MYITRKTSCKDKADTAAALGILNKIACADTLWNLHWCAPCNRAVLHPEFNILVIISKSAAKDRKTADVFGTVRHGHPEIDLVAVIQVELVDRDIGDPCIINENAIVVDNKCFQKSVLVPVCKPPVRCEKSFGVGKVTRTCPDTDKRII